MSIFTLPLVVAAVCARIFINPSDDIRYFFNWQNVVFDPINKLSWLNYFLSVVLISINAHQLNHVFNRNSFFTKDTFLPGFIYICGLATFRSVDFTPMLIADLLVIGAFASLLQLKRQEPAKSQIFIASFLIGLAIVLSPLLIVLALLPWLSLIIIRPFIWRDWILALLGLFIPVLYHYVINFSITGMVKIDRIDFLLDAPQFENNVFSQVAYGVFAFCMLIALFRTISVMRSQLVSFKKITQVVIASLILLSFSFLIGWYGFSQMYLTLFLPVGFIISIQLLYSPRPQLSSTLVTLWFMAALIQLFVS